MKEYSNIIDSNFKANSYNNGKNVFYSDTQRIGYDSIIQEREQDKALRMRQVSDMVDELNSTIFDDEEYYTFFLSNISYHLDNYIKSNNDYYLKLVIVSLNEYGRYLDQEFKPIDDDINFIVEEYINDLEVESFDEKRYENKKNNFCRRFGDKIGKDLLKYGVSCGKGNEYLFKKLRIEDWISKRIKYKKKKDIDDIKKRYEASEFLPSNINQRNIILDYNIIRKWSLSYLSPESYEIESTGTINENHIQYAKYDVVNTEDIVGSMDMRDCRKGFIDGNVGGDHPVEATGLLDSMKEEGFVFDQGERFVQLEKYLGFNGKPLYFVTGDGNHRVAVAKSLNIPKIVAVIEDYSIESDREKEKSTRDETLVNDWIYRISKGYIDGRIIKDGQWYRLKYTKGCFDGCCMSKADLSRYVDEYQNKIGNIDEKNMVIIQDMLNN